MNRQRRSMVRRTIVNLQAAAQQLENVRAAESAARANTPANFRKEVSEDVADVLTLIEGAQRDLDEIIHCLECIEYSV